MNERIQRVIGCLLALMLGVVGVAAFTLGRGVAISSGSLGLPPLISPADNPITPEKITLGRKLFFDKRLSVDNSISCATCHDPAYGFADPHAVSVGVKGRQGKRNSHTLLNTAYIAPLMWDGRATTLEEQSLLPFISPLEFDLPVEVAVEKLRRNGYSSLFKHAFGEDVTVDNLAKALAVYQRSLAAGDSPFDRYIFRKDVNAISPEARRGFDIFLEAKCDACHIIMTPGLHPFAVNHVVFTDGKFHNLGIGAEKNSQDPGRYEVTKERRTGTLSHTDAPQRCSHSTILSRRQCRDSR